MSVAAWHEEPIRKTHDRQAFDCGEAALNEFLQRHARKSHELGGAKTFLAIEDAGNKAILGFYSLSPAAVEYSRCRSRALADNFCLRLACVVCWHRRKWAASRF